MTPRGAKGFLPWLAGTACLVLVLCACGAAAREPLSVHRSVSAPSPPTVPGEATKGPDLSGVRLPKSPAPVTSGPVSRPLYWLTPGVVTTTDANTVCGMPPHATPPAIPPTLKATVFSAYGYSLSNAKHSYILNYLVPYDLGGAAMQANLWPVALNGTGFYQKTQINHVLRDMVCRHMISLAGAQHALETDWYTAWLKYVKVAGHI